MRFARAPRQPNPRHSTAARPAARGDRVQPRCTLRMGTRSGSVLSTTGGLLEDRTMMGRLEPDGKTVASTADYGRCTCGGVFEKRFVEIQMGPAERKVV